VGPAVVCEGFDNRTNVKGEDVFSPVRIGAMLTFIYERTDLLGDARLVFQPVGTAFSTMTDYRLKVLGLWVRNQEDHMRAAVRHAVTLLRRARQSDIFRDEIWNPAA
jgi:hypothetical protein